MSDKLKSTPFSSYETLIRLMPGHVYWKNKEGVYLGCNQKMADFLGLSIDDIIGKTDHEIAFNKEIADTVTLNDIKAMRSKMTLNVEELITLKDGSKVTFLSKKIAIYDENGEVAGLLGISFDLSRMKQEFLRINEEKNQVLIALDNIMAALPGHVYWQDKNNVFLGCNELQAKAAGLKSRHEIVGKTNYYT